jgi:hypothetical protein
VAVSNQLLAKMLANKYHEISKYPFLLHGPVAKQIPAINQKIIFLKMIGNELRN